MCKLALLPLRWLKRLGRRSRRIRFTCWVLFLLTLVVIGHTLEFRRRTYEFLAFSDLTLTIINIPERWNLLPPSKFKITSDLYTPEGLTNHRELYDHMELWKESTLLNLKFSWIYNNPTLCKMDKNSTENGLLHLLPIVVNTARSHFTERLTLRKTIGSAPIYRNWVVKLIFLLGETDNQLATTSLEKETQKIHEEHLRYGDIVMGNFGDSYRNLTYKHLMGYKWILNFCQDADFFLKMDDDLFVDVLRFIDWRTEDLKNKPEAIPDLYCHTIRGANPRRNKNSKWYLSEKDWPSEYFPNYCSGAAHAITVKLTEKIYNVSNLIKFLWLEDVFVTGVLMEMAKEIYKFKPKVKHLWGQLGGNLNDYRELCENQSWNQVRYLRAVTYTSRDNFFEKGMLCLWNKTLHDRGLTNRKLL